MKTVLSTRTLWYDGTSEVDASLVPELFLLGAQPENLVVTAADPDIDLFNAINDIMIPATKESNRPADLSWDIPSEFANVSLPEKVHSLLERWLLSNSAADVGKYRARVDVELKEIARRDLTNLFRALLYIVHVLRENDTVWGVGRGSSCASLILFLMGLHKVDPVKYDISHTEFFHG